MKYAITLSALLMIGSLSAWPQQVVPTVTGQNPTQNLFVQQGLDYLEEGEFQQAQAIFSVLRNDNNFANIHADANYWFAQSALASGDLESARDGFDRFIAQFGDHPRNIEAHYHRARLNYSLGEYHQAIESLATFRERYPTSDFVGNSYYWSGEAHLALGERSEAMRMFRTVLEEYPLSFRVESARHKLSLIDVSQREEELLDILRWSHEEYLTLRSGVPDPPVASAPRTDDDIADTDEELLAEYRSQINRLQSEIELLEEIAGRTPPQATPIDPNTRAALLELREQLLDLKEEIVTETSIQAQDQ